MNELYIERVEEILSEGVIGKISLSAHATLHARSVQESLKGNAHSSNAISGM